MRKHLIACLAILSIALFFRLWDLGHLPAGFQFDEAVAGYNAYSVLKTGSNVYSQYLALYVDTFGDYRPMGIVYLIVPVVALLGLNEEAVRLPAAIFGAFSPVLLYFLVWQLFKKRSVAVLSGLLLAISPWHIILSRATAEQVVGIFMTLLITNLAIFALERKPFWWFFTYLTLLLSFWTYTGTNPFIILFLPFLTLYLYLKASNKKKLRLWLVVVAAYLIFPVATIVFLGPATSRARQVVNLYSQQQIDKFISQELDGTSTYVTRLFHNKPIIILQTVTERYTDYFSGKFLLFEGGSAGRYQIPKSGVVNFVTVIGIGIWLLGLAASWRQPKIRPILILVGGWLLVGPLVAAITSDGHPNMSRASNMIVPLVILGAMGLSSLTGLIKLNLKRICFVLLLGISLWHFAYFWHEYSVHARGDEWLNRNYPSRIAAQKLSKVPKKYQVLATTYFLDTHIYSLFFEKIDPKIAQEAYKNAKNNEMSFLNYRFTGAGPCASKMVEHTEYQIYLDSSYCDEPDWATVIPIPMANGSIGAKILIDKTQVTEDLRL